MHNIKVGDRLEMRFKGDGTMSKIFLSQVLEYENDTVVVYTPISYGKLVVLAKSAPCSLLFFQEEGMLSFTATVVESYVKDDLNLTKLVLTSEPEKMQRREFFRFECALPIKFSIINSKQSEFAQQGSKESGASTQPLYEGVIKDLGGGGLRFVTNAEVESGDNVKCLLLLEREYIVVIGKVLQKHSFPKSPFKFQYRIIFIGILPEEKDKIIQYVFSQQRKQLLRQRRGISANTDVE